MRRVGMCSLLVFVAACSGGDDSEPLATAPASPSTSTSITVADGGDELSSASDAPAAPDETPIAVSVTLTRGPSTEIVVERDDIDDPFETFASCSGWRSVVGAYSVLVSSPSGTVTSFSLLTNEPIDGPGIHDADVRIERSSGDPIDTTGTVTLDEGLATGTFTTFALDGTPLEGEFECDTPVTPELLEVGRNTDVLEAVEVFALLRDGDAERVIGLAVTPETNPDAACPAAEGLRDAPVLVRVDGDDTIGAITTFELTGGQPTALRLRAGTTVYEFDDVELELDGSATSGIFAASDGSGLTIDGAFRCT